MLPQTDRKIPKTCIEVNVRLGIMSVESLESPVEATPGGLRNRSGKNGSILWTT